MKKSTFDYMIKNPPQGATHYRKYKLCVVFYKNVDDTLGSFSQITWWEGEMEPAYNWCTYRDFLCKSQVVKV